MTIKTTTRLLKISSLLVLSAILVNFSPFTGKSFSKSINNSETTLNESVQKKLTEFRSWFAENTEPGSEILFTGKIKNGKSEITSNGEIRYIFNRNGQTFRITEKFLGAEPAPRGIDPKTIPFYNLKGKTPAPGPLSMYGQIGFGEIYNDVSVLLRPADGNIEKVITLKPGADPSAIKIKLEGPQEIKIAGNGKLAIHNEKNGENFSVGFSAPVAWQMINGRRTDIEIGYKLLEENTYGFTIGKYDPAYELVIDPVLYSTFVGGEDTEEYTSETHTSNNIMVIAVDPADSEEYVYVTGYTDNGGDFPADFVPPATAAERSSHDIFIVKMPLDLSEISASALVGGDGSDIYSSITADSSGNIYLAFKTNSTDLPTTASSYQTAIGGSQDIAVMKLPPSLASVTAATYLGGNKADDPGNIEVSNGYVYVSGVTSNSGGGNTFPASPTSGADEVYSHVAGSTDYEITISRFNDQLSNTYYAGTFIQTGMGSPSLKIHSPDTNPDNDKVFITGRTDNGLEIVDPVNAYQPTYGGGANDKFIARFNSRLTTLEASTFLGGSSSSYGLGSINIYNAGGGVYKIITSNDTGSATGFFDILRTDGNNHRYDYDGNPNNGVINGCADEEIYVGNFNFNLTEASVAVVCGDGTDYYPRSTVDSSGNIYLAGTTASTNLPVPVDAYQSGLQDYYDIFLMKFPNDLSSLTSGTYLGGMESTEYYSAGLQTDSLGNLYVTGQTYSMDFPSTPGTVRSYKNYTDSDYFVTAITNDLYSPCAPIYDNEDTDGAGDISAVSQQCLGTRVTPAPAYFEYIPASFSFPPKYATTIAQSSFNNTEIGSDDIITVRDLSGSGSFSVTIQASEFTNGYETIDLSNLYVVTTAPGSANLNILDSNLNGTTTSEQITYADGSLGQNITAPQKTTGSISYPATFITSGSDFSAGPVTLMSAASASHYLRASMGLSFYLNIPPNTTPGTYSTIFTVDLIQN